nr:MAG TPA: hypothetical protein [Caudoviricetes sp.]
MVHQNKPALLCGFFFYILSICIICNYFMDGYASFT